MPIMYVDPWRRQYFEGVPCPEGTLVPTKDSDAYELFPRQRWVYNKLRICETQTHAGIAFAPHGVTPPSFPVFSKPIFNLRGMGAGSRLFATAEEYERNQMPGHMWMSVCTGDHVSSDIAVVQGQPCWWRHAVGMPTEDGMFDFWVVVREARPAVETYCGSWVRRWLPDYTGMLNIETLGGVIIECHLRFSCQFIDLYGEGFSESVVALYAGGRWHFDDCDPRTGYSVMLFGPTDRAYRALDPAVVSDIAISAGLSSIQLTLRDDKPIETHVRAPGGIRLAIVNSWDLDAARGARSVLRQLLVDTPDRDVLAGQRKLSDLPPGAAPVFQ